MDMKTRFVEVNGLKLNVFDEGSGDPVLLLHGFPDSHKVWRHVAPKLLEAGYRVITFDQRGFGDSDAPVGVENYKVENMLKDIAVLLPTLGVKEKVKLVGHDWGSTVGWSASMHLPQLVESYVAISTGHPAAYANDGGFEQRQKGWYVMCFMFEGRAEEMFSQNDWATLRLFTDHHPELDTHWLPDMSREGRFTAGLNWYRANVKKSPDAPPYPDVTVPVLGIYSDQDMYLSEAQMVNSQKYVTGGWEYRPIKDCRHWIPLDKPEELTSILLDYWKRLK